MFVVVDLQITMGSLNQSEKVKLSKAKPTTRNVEYCSVRSVNTPLFRFLNA